LDIAVSWSFNFVHTSSRFGKIYISFVASLDQEKRLMGKIYVSPSLGKGQPHAAGDVCLRLTVCLWTSHFKRKSNANSFQCLLQWSMLRVIRLFPGHIDWSCLSKLLHLNVVVAASKSMNNDEWKSHLRIKIQVKQTQFMCGRIHCTTTTIWRTVCATNLFQYDGSWWM